MITFDIESVGSNSSSITSCVVNQTKFNKDICYNCQKQGHWMRDCPTKTPQNPKKVGQSTTSSFRQRHVGLDGSQYSSCLLCPCGAGTCPLRTSKTEKNPDRMFFTCPNANKNTTTTKCRFFKWFDEVESDEFTNVPICGCGAGPCGISTETSGPNAGCKFFICPIKKGQGACNFFKWHDAEVITTTNGSVDENTSSPQSTLINDETSPANSVLVEGDSSHQGIDIESSPVDTRQHPHNLRAVYGVSKRDKAMLVEGQGVCNFFKWHDDEVITTTNGSVDVDENMSSPVSTLINFDETSPANSVPVKGDSSHQGIDIESSPVDTRRVSGVSKRGKAKLGEVNGQEDTFDDPLPKHCKRLRHGAPKVNCSVLSYGTECLGMPQAKSMDFLMQTALQVSVLTSEAEIHRRQAEFRRQISIAGTTFPASSASSYSCSSALPTTLAPLGQNCFVTTDFRWNLGLHFDGWWGKIAFPPSRCLTIPAPRPFFCCVFPSFDPISMPQNVDAFDAEASAITPPLQVAQPLGASFCKPYLMEGSISEAFGRAAVHLQNGLLTLLDSMNFHDHESMTREACVTFSALDRLKEFIEYQPFCERVKEFIACASTFSKIDWSIRNNYSCREELVNLYNREEKRLADISRVHAEAMDGLEASRERLQFLQKEATRLRDLLFQVETELCCVETENRDLEKRFVQISKDMADSEGSLKVASRNAETARKLCQEREAERDAAKVAFEKAKMIMRRQ